MNKLTGPQTKALASLYLLTVRYEAGQMISWRNIDGYMSRIQIGGQARGSAQGYPIKTMRALQAHGLVKPHSEYTVDLVVKKICRCGCDRWTLTDEGRKAAESMNIKVVDDPRTRMLSR